MSDYKLVTSELFANQTGFLNGFLDELLELYCAKRYQPNTCLLSPPNITLNSIISDYYPGYYYRGEGLICKENTTDVKIIFDKNLESQLEVALQHKIFTLFLHYIPNVPTLGHDMNLQRHRGFYNPLSEYLTVSSKSSILDKLNKKFDSDMSYSDFDELLPKDSTYIKIRSTLNSDHFFIYKPTTDFVSTIAVNLHNQNKDYFKSRTTYFSDHPVRDKFNIIFAYDMIEYKDRYLKYFDPEFVEELYNKAKSITAQFNRMFHKRVDDSIAPPPTPIVIDSSRYYRSRDYTDVEDVIPPPPPPPTKTSKQIQDELNTDPESYYTQIVFSTVAMICAILFIYGIGSLIAKGLSY